MPTKDYLKELVKTQAALEAICEEAEIDKHDETTSPFFCDDSAQM